MVIEKETAVPENYRGQLDRQWAALYGVLVQLQPTMVDQVFAQAGRRKKGETRAVLPKWAEEVFGTATVETSFLELPDGRILEEIYTKGGAAFVVYTPVPERWTIAPEIQVEGSRPSRPVQPEFLECITLARRSRGCENAAAVIDEIEALSTEIFRPRRGLRHLPIDDSFGVRIMDSRPTFSLEVLGGATTVLPGLQAVGLPGTGKGRRLAVVRHFFYRTIYLLHTTKVPSLYRTIRPGDGGRQ